MDILLLGGSGDIGFNVVKQLSSMKEVGRLVIADNNITLSQEKVKQENLKRDVFVVHINVDEEQDRLPKIMERADFVINCIGPFYHFGLIAARAAVEAGVHFIDICDEYHAMKEIFSLDSLAKEKGILLLTGMGWSPGLTNLAVKKMAAGLSQIERVQISLCSNSASIKSLGMITHLLYCKREGPVFYRDHRLVEPEDSREERGIVNFLPPFEDIMVDNIIHPELYSLPLYYPGVQEVVVRGSTLPPWLYRLAQRLVRFPLFQSDKYLEGLASHFYRYQLLFSHKTHPYSALRIDLWGEVGEEKRHRVFRMIEKKGDMVGLSIATALLMLKDGSRVPTGVYAPEGLFDPLPFFENLETQGLEMREERRKIL